MTNRYELYKCDICGNVIEILVSGDGHPVCCGEEMERVEVKNDIKNSAALTEKHSPVISAVDNGNKFITVKNHPMEKEHYIMFLQTISDDKKEIRTRFFNPTETVEMELCADKTIMARSYCNIHGLYITE